VLFQVIYSIQNNIYDIIDAAVVHSSRFRLNMTDKGQTNIDSRQNSISTNQSLQINCK